MPYYNMKNSIQREYNKSDNGSTMDPVEIAKLLNSNEYISPSRRKELEEKLEYHKKTNRFSPLDEFFSTIAPGGTKKDKPKDQTVHPLPMVSQNETNFPELGNSGNKNKVLDYSALIKQQSSTTNSTIKPLFVSNKMEISYNDIKKMYDDYGIYRIQMQYVLLNRKIHIIDTISLVNIEKGEKFKKYFDYGYLIQTENKMKICLEIFIATEKILSFAESLQKFLKEYAQRGNSFIKSAEKTLKELNITMHDLMYVNDLFRDIFSQYQSPIKNYFIFVEKLLNQIRSGININSNINADIKKNTTMIDEIKKNNKKIIEDFDPHINCDYCISFGSYNESNITPIGLANSVYIPCDEISFYIQNKHLNDHILRTITEKELESLFTKNKKMKNFKYFISIWIKHPSCKKIYIKFNIDEEIPCSKINPKIIGLPPKSLVLSSIIHNENSNDLLENTQIIIPHIKTSKNNWLMSKIKNQLYRITENEYQNIDIGLQNAYSYENTDTNAFVVDYLFNELLLNDETNTIIKPEMAKSFRNFAKNNSITSTI